MIYFIQNEATKAIKIGYTTGQPEGRLKQLQTASPDLLRLLGAISGSASDERLLHGRFGHLRLSGEWFKPDAELICGMRDLLRRGISGEDRPFYSPDLQEITSRLVGHRVQILRAEQYRVIPEEDVIGSDYEGFWYWFMDLRNYYHKSPMDACCSYVRSYQIWDRTRPNEAI